MLLSIGLIKDEIALKAFPHNENGCNKCLFRENS